MPSSEVYSAFVSKGFDISGSDYNRFDTLESNDDMAMLFEVLHSHKDSKDNRAVFTANIVVGNPNFKKIRDSGFIEYFFEPVTETLKKYPEHDKVEKLWKIGYEDRIFHPTR